MKTTLVLVLPIILLFAACGSTEQTSGFFVGATTGDTVTIAEEIAESSTVQQSLDSPAPMPSDTLLNCSFTRVLDRPFGPDLTYNVYNGALHIENYYFNDPVVLLSNAGLVKDGLVQASFVVTDAPAHAVVGLVLRADGTDNFLLLGVNGRGQYTVQRCINGLWIPVMGLDSFESSRLLPYALNQVELTAEVHGSYTDFYVNGQLIQVVKTTIPPTGQIGVFVDAKVNADLDRIMVLPL